MLCTCLMYKVYLCLLVQQPRWCHIAPGGCGKYVRQGCVGKMHHAAVLWVINAITSTSANVNGMSNKSATLDGCTNPVV